MMNCMKNRLKARFFVMMTFATLLTACSPVGFQAVTDTGTGVTSGTPATVPPTCTVETILRKSKILFLVDTSGSNAYATYNPVGNQSVYTQATDPTKSFRAGAIQNFVTTYQHKTNFHWSFATFSEGEAYAYINSGTYQTPVFSANAAVMTDAVTRFRSQIDEGDTPYGAAIRLATKAIANDPDLSSADKPNYYVILLSDGFPSDYVDSRGSFDATVMKSDVANLLARAPGRVSLSTIFYGTMNIPSAISALQQIAAAGGGQSASVNVTNSSFKIDDVIASTSACP